MINKIFSGSHALWNWVVTSSADPNQVALTVKGFLSLGVVQTIFSLLPLVGIHPSFDLNGLGDQVYTVVYGGLSLITGGIGFVGALRKLLYTFFGTPATQ